MSLNSSMTSVIINNLTTGGLYTARVAGVTHAGIGPYSNPVLLNMDPGQLVINPSYTDQNHNNTLFLFETWFHLLILIICFSIIATLFCIIYAKRRQEINKQIGHLSVPVSTTNDICQLNKDTLWLERGWRPSNTFHSSSDKDCETKLLNNHMIPPGIINMAGSEYAEVNLTTFYNSKKTSAPPEPYATTTLCVSNHSPDSMDGSFQKSNSSDSCLKPDYSSLDSTQEPNKSTISPSSDNMSSSVYADENCADQQQRRKQANILQIQQDSPSMPNWCDMLPPPPEHPPPPTNSLSIRVIQQSAMFSPHLSKRNFPQKESHSTKSQSPPTPPTRIGVNNYSTANSWSSCEIKNNYQQPPQQVKHLNLQSQANNPPVSSFPQNLNHYDLYKAQENEYESGSLIYGHQNTLLSNNIQLSHSGSINEEIELNDDSFRNDNSVYRPENDEWERKSCDSITNSDICCSCSESSCLYAETIQYNNQFSPSLLQLKDSSCGNHQIENCIESRLRNNSNSRRRNRSSSPTYSSDSNYSCNRKKNSSSFKSQEKHKQIRKFHYATNFN